MTHSNSTWGTLFTLLVLTSACETPTLRSPLVAESQSEVRSSVVDHPQGRGRRMVMSSSPTGTGSTDYYNLFARLEGTVPVAYGMSFATRSKVSVLEAKVTADIPEPIQVIMRENPRINGKSVNIVEAEFGSAFLAAAKGTGANLQVSTPEKVFDFQIPSWMFVELDRQSEARDWQTLQKDLKTQMRVARENYIANNPDLNPSFAEAIREERLAIGMSANDVRASWGAPDRKSSRINAMGSFESWWYGTSTMVELHNGVVDSVYTSN